MMVGNPSLAQAHVPGYSAAPASMKWQWIGGAVLLIVEGKNVSTLAMEVPTACLLAGAVGASTTDPGWPS